MKKLGVALCVVVTLCLAGASLAFAVPPGSVSWTAEAVCEFRAIAAQHPDPKLRNKDNLAGKLCGQVLLPRKYASAREMIDGNPEAYAGYFYVNARTRHIDARLVQAAAAGVSQVVVLGAGFDSRAYRFHRAYPKLAFFEVDLPATSGAKQAAVKRLFGALPAYVHYAPIDFNTQTLEGVLGAAGYDPAKKTFFILEGVAMYVAEPGNVATFGFMHKHAASGSMVVYDYVLRRVVEGEYEGLYGAGSAATGVAYRGEPFVTGWNPQEAADFANRLGLTVLNDLDASELTRRYLTGSNGKPDGKMTDWQRIIDAKVR